MSLLEQAIDLGREISKSDEFKRMMLSEEELKKDKDALKLVEDFQGLQKIYETRAMNGQPVTRENIEGLEELEKKIMANETVRLYYEASGRFQALVGLVNDKIREGMTGIAHECRSG